MSENEAYSISSIICSAVSVRVRRNEMGALFCTIPWYLSSEESFRIQESKWAYILTLNTSQYILLLGGGEGVKKEGQEKGYAQSFVFREKQAL